MKIFSHSSSDSFPVAIFWLSTKLSPESKRIASCSRDISKEKNATVERYFFATFKPIFSAKEVLPMAGRAAIRRRFEEGEIVTSSTGEPYTKYYEEQWEDNQR